MMNINDIQIGNIVKYNFQYLIVKNIDTLRHRVYLTDICNSCNRNFSGNPIRVEDVEPIEIKDFLIHSLGFTENKDMTGAVSYHYNHIAFGFDLIKTCIGYAFHTHECKIGGVKYLHEIQNIMKAMYNQMHIFKLKDSDIIVKIENSLKEITNTEFTIKQVCNGYDIRIKNPLE